MIYQHMLLDNVGLRPQGGHVPSSKTPQRQNIGKILFRVERNVPSHQNGSLQLNLAGQAWQPIFHIYRCIYICTHIVLQCIVRAR